MANRIVDTLKTEFNIENEPFGTLDISFYRDDVYRDSSIKSYTSKIDVSLENKNVVLIDDVLYTGRTVRSAMDAILDYGRPNKVELCVLIDRKFSRHLPIQADYVGKAIDSNVAQKVKVQWAETDNIDQILLLN
jgi:pyrimidine operon attenuation protein/uracil phosphoribosyltransferase